MNTHNPSPPETGSRGSSRILVVDDESVMLKMMVHALSGTGHWCASASSGTEAIALLRRHSFDLSVVDKNLPDISGIEVARRSRDMFRKVPVIIVTGFPSDESRREAEELGVTSYMVKPFDVEALRREVNAVLDEFWRVSREPIGSRPPSVAPQEVPTRPPPRRRSRRSRFSAPVLDEPRTDIDVDVLLLEPDDEIRQAIADSLERAGCRVSAVRSRHRAEVQARSSGYDVLITRPELIEGTKHWATLVPGEPPLGTVALVDSDSVDRHIEAIQAGAMGVLMPPFTDERIAGRFGAAVDLMREERERVTIPPDNR